MSQTADYKTWPLEEQIKYIKMARDLGLAATQLTYAQWRDRVLTFAQLLKEESDECTIQQDSDN